MSSPPAPPGTLFTGCRPEVLAGPGGRILALGEQARRRAAPGSPRVELEGEVLPGLGDAHLHLDGLVRLRAGLDLRPARSAAEVLELVAGAARDAEASSWVLGQGWDGNAWPDRVRPSRQQLDRAAGGRPVLLVSKDEHSVWASSRALALAGIGPDTPDPRGGLIDREPGGQPSGTVREARWLFDAVLPEPEPAAYVALLEPVLRELAAMGLCCVHSMDRRPTLAALQTLHRERRLPLRVVVNLPAEGLASARELGLSTGYGDSWLRIWGVKAFLDGSLGSHTAEMLGGGGVTRTADPELEELVRGCVDAHLNLCLHAIGDGAVRRALAALLRHRAAWPGWRPRIEHAQCVDPEDVPRFAAAGVVASMQPLHAVSDREMADREWGERTGHAYAWARLLGAGVPLAFGSDAPVESADPLRGLDAATAWRSRARWHPDLALSREQALVAYSSGVAFAAGLEDQLGRLLPGYRCDLTVVREGRVTATVVGGQVVARGAA